MHCVFQSLTHSIYMLCLETDSFHDFTGSEDVTTALQKAMSNSFAYDGIAQAVNSTDALSETTVLKTFYVYTTMRIERYYASVKDQSSALTDDAKVLLNNKDYIGFFKACGPAYVRGIRRAQEVVTSYEFQSSNTDRAIEFAASLSKTEETDGLSNSTTTTQAESTKFENMSRTMKISIKGYGLGLNQDGSGVLIARSLSELNDVMSFAFKIMTSHPEAHHVGMVQGMEVVPWVNNIKFQVAAQLNDEVVEIPIPKSLIPRSFKIADRSDFSYTTATRAEFMCKTAGYQIDKWGYCCEPQSLYDLDALVYNADAPEDRACRPVRGLDKNVVKENLSNNGEFVARLDQTLNYKLVNLATLQMCISSINGYPTQFDGNYLVSHASSLDTGDSIQLTVFDMKQAMDPFGDMGMVKQMGRELDEFVKMFYSPCLAALFGANAGGSGSSASYFMAYPWYTHPECGYMSCLAGGMRWDRVNGGCVPGMSNGSGASPYDTTVDDSESQCAFDTESDGDVQTCTDSTASLVEFQDTMNGCWSSGGSSIELYMQSYCMPKVSADVHPDINAYKAEVACNTEVADAAANAAPARRRKLNSTEQQNKRAKEERLEKIERSRVRSEEFKRRRGL